MASGRIDSLITPGLKRTVAWMDTALAVLHEGIVLLDAESGTILFATEPFAQMVGKERIFLLGMHIGDILHLASTSGAPLAQADSPWSAAQRDPQQPRSYLTESSQGMRHLEIIVRDFDWTDEDGKPVKHLILIQRDITKRKQEQEALRRSEEQHRLLIDSVKDYSIILLDQKGIIASWNPGAEKIKGYRAEEIIGNHFSRFYTEDDRRVGKPTAELRAAAAAGRFEDEGWRIRKDGSLFWANVIITVARDQNGKIVGYSQVTRDLSARKRAEDAVLKAKTVAEAANKELETFCYSIAHDLRAPLRAADGYSQVLLEKHAQGLNDDGKDFLSRIRQSTARMGKMIDDLLRLSRVTRGEMRRDRVDLSALATEVVADLKNAQPDREVEFAIAKDLETEGDASLLRLALENLLGNSWKFTGRLPKAHIEFAATERDGKRAYFVRDDGAGFDMAYSGKLFTPFARLHTLKEFDGTGIGLATVQRIIQRHGGRIWGEGKVGRGATFYFSLWEGKI